MATLDGITQDRIIMQMLWNQRHQEPNLCVRITEKDVEALDQCLEYNKQKPQIKTVVNAGGLFVVLVDQDGNAVTPIENNEQDYDKAMKARKVAAARENIALLANMVKNRAAMGEFSQSDVNDLADAAMLVAGVA